MNLYENQTPEVPIFFVFFYSLRGPWSACLIWAAQISFEILFLIIFL